MFMGKKLFSVAIILTMVLLVVIVSWSVNSRLVWAQTNSDITILANGDIKGTRHIQRQGDIYTFTGDIYGSITVQKSGITLDGAGYTFQGVYFSRGIDLIGYSSSPTPCSNVVVKNLRIYNSGSMGIYTASNNNSFMGNTFDGSGIHVIWGGEGNIIKRNLFNSSTIVIDYNNGGNDVIVENNFINSGIFVTISKPPHVDRNYWSDYATKYPNAKEIGNSGIWNTPYDYDMPNSSHGTYPCIDNNPLIQPHSLENSDNLPIENKPQPFLTALVTVAVVAVVVISVSLLIYFKKHSYASSC